MGLVMAGAFTGILSSYRLCWIGGRFGGHKTSFAYYLAKDYLERGYRLISNNRCIWSDTIEKVNLNENNQLHAVIVLDEGGMEFKSSRQIEMIAAYARKMDVIYLIPSFWPPTRAAQVITVQPVFNFKSAGIPLVMYKWRVKLGAFQDQGFFGWWYPNEIYGIYSSLDPGDRAGDIVSWLVQKTTEYRERSGRGDADGLPDLEETGGSAVLSDKLDDFAAAVDDLAAIPVRGRRFGRRI